MTQNGATRVNIPERGLSESGLTAPGLVRMSFKGGKGKVFRAKSNFYFEYYRYEFAGYAVFYAI
jgi:hypothetical protein